MRQVVLCVYIINNLVIFYIFVSPHDFIISIISFNILIIYVLYLVNLPQTTHLLQTVIYKERYDCKWDPLTMTNNTLYDKRR